MAWTFGPIREGLIANGVSRAAVDNLELALRSIRSESSVNVDDILAMAAAMDFVPLTLAEIASALDNNWLTAAGDDYLTTGGDKYLIEG
jgi:hypothetical protein